MVQHELIFCLRYVSYPYNNPPGSFSQPHATDTARQSHLRVIDTNIIIGRRSQPYSKRNYTLTCDLPEVLNLGAPQSISSIPSRFAPRLWQGRLEVFFRLLTRQGAGELLITTEKLPKAHRANQIRDDMRARKMSDLCNQMKPNKFHQPQCRATSCFNHARSECFPAGLLFPTPPAIFSLARRYFEGFPPYPELDPIDCIIQNRLRALILLAKQCAVRLHKCCSHKKTSTFGFP